MRCKRPLAVDCIIEMDGKIVLIERKYGRFVGKYALPGGMVERNETVLEAVVREVKEETGLDVEVEGFVGIYSSPDRDERGVITLVFHGKGSGELKPGDDAKSAVLVTPKKALQMDLAFDHSRIIEDWVAGKRCVIS